MEVFAHGDKLRTIRNVDEDGERMEGSLEIGDVVTMRDRTSYNRPFIIVERADGRKWQLEASRFELVEMTEDERHDAFWDDVYAMSKSDPQE